MNYILYRTTCKVNNKFYVGKHQTENLDDGYLGSGILLRKAIRKYGKESFVREILGTYSSAEELNAAEKSFITEEVLRDPNCYNLAIGGQGGFLGESVRQKMKDRWTDELKEAQRQLLAKTKTSEKYRRSLKSKVPKQNWNAMSEDDKLQQQNRMSETLKNLWKSSSHRAKMKKVRSKVQTSEKFVNATKGSRWMNSDSGECKLVKPEQIENFLSAGWKFGNLNTKKDSPADF